MPYTGQQLAKRKRSTESPTEREANLFYCVRFKGKFWPLVFQREGLFIERHSVQLLA